MIYNALNITHEFLKATVKPGANVIDATSGNGFDTVFLCELVGNSGHVTAFDIQREAVNATQNRVNASGYSNTCDVILDSHSNLDRYFEKGSVDAVIFNFGWLPGGDHTIFTKKDTSIAAIECALELLKPHGALSLCIYYGKNNGYEERDAILSFVKDLDFKKYTVIQLSFSNRINNPPFPIFIIKEV